MIKWVKWNNEAQISEDGVFLLVRFSDGLKKAWWVQKYTHTTKSGMKEYNSIHYTRYLKDAKRFVERYIKNNKEDK